jgi:hypothetical protein
MMRRGEEVIDWGFLEMAAVAGYHPMIRAAGTDVEARQEVLKKWNKYILSYLFHDIYR